MVEVRISAEDHGDIEEILSSAPIAEGLLQERAQLLGHDVLEGAHAQRVRRLDVGGAVGTDRLIQVLSR